MYLPPFILAYHGCEREVGEAILSGKEPFKVQRNGTDWLGTGAYFWENDPFLAWDWVKPLPDGTGSRQEPFVLGAIIEPGRCLDLTEVSFVEEIREAHRLFTAFHDRMGLPLPKNEEAFPGDRAEVHRHLDCAVMAFLLQVLCEEKKRQPYDTVRGFFGDGAPVYGGSAFRSHMHVQICVPEPEKRGIYGYFRLPKRVTAQFVPHRPSR